MAWITLLRNESIRAAPWGVGLWVALLATYVAYAPGLSGPFLLDDFANLSALGRYGGVDNLATLKEYVLGGIAGFTGRPLSLLSFLIDANTWPAEPYSFKYTNLLIHLINGTLLFALLLQLLTASRQLSLAAVRATALVVAAGWMLHPFLVSTTMYVVQRMTLLSATCVLAGLLGYVLARRSLEQRPRRSLIAMTAALAVGGGVGMLAKENAGLIVPLALVLELTLLPPPKSSRGPYRAWRIAVLVLPTILLLGYLVSRGLNGLDGYGGRDFSSIERLLTQGRIVAYYLYCWFVPQTLTPGLLNQDIALSTGLFAPPRTAAALVFLTVLAVTGWLLRRRYPAYPAAVGFFLTGHLLESTTIPLELYFEHRNYLPSALLWLPVVAGCIALARHRRVLYLPIILLPLVLAPMTHIRASTWGDARSLTLSWIEENPRSPRAYQSAALVLYDNGQPHDAWRVIRRGTEAAPNNLLLHLKLAQLECRLGDVRPQTLEGLHRSLDAFDYSLAHYPLLASFVRQSGSGNCTQLNSELAASVLTAINDSLPEQLDSRHRQIRHLHGILELARGRACQAYRWFEHSTEAGIRREAVLQQAALLAQHGLHAEALAHLGRLGSSSREGSIIGTERAASSEHLREQIRRYAGDNPLPSCEGVTHSRAQPR